jgi:hypothetical protein
MFSLRTSSKSTEQGFDTKPSASRILHRQWASWVIGLAPAIGLALAAQLWTALQGVANFDSDEAILGLMARHTLQGRLPTYFYGQRYLGSLETLLSAAFMWLFGKDIITFRMSALLLFGIFLVLHAALVFRLWGFRVALLSLWVLALPAPLIRTWTFRPISGFGAIFVLGTGLLLLSLLHISRRRLNYLRMGVLGMMIGLGFWSHPMIVVYVFTCGVVYWVQSPEWAALHQKLSILSERVMRMPVRKLLPVAMLGVIGLGVTAFFSGGCTPQASFTVVRTVARISLLGGGVGLALFTFLTSKRRNQLISGVISLVAGFVIGNFPQWRAWLFFGIAPETAVRPSCPTDAIPRMPLLGGELLPTVWGIPSLERISGMPPVQIVLWSIALLVVGATLISFFWTERKALWSFLALSPLSRTNRRVLICTMLFGLPVVLVALSSNTIDVSSVRYLVVAWQASSVLLAIFLARLVTRKTSLGVLLVTFWIAFVGVNNLLDQNSARPAHSGSYAPNVVPGLEAFMKQRNLQGGYADYWVAYTLDFLTEEQFSFAPFNVIDRYPPYTQKVRELPVQVYIFERNIIPNNISTVDELVHELRGKKNARLGIFPQIIKDLDNDVLVERRNVSGLDVWVVRNQHP